MEETFLKALFDPDESNYKVRIQREAEHRYFPKDSIPNIKQMAQANAYYIGAVTEYERINWKTLPEKPFNRLAP